MCNALEELRREGVLEGRLEGIRATIRTSFISDTTVVATQTQNCKMSDKFKVNSMIVSETSMGPSRSSLRRDRKPLQACKGKQGTLRAPQHD